MLKTIRYKVIVIAISIILLLCTLFFVFNKVFTPSIDKVKDSVVMVEVYDSNNSLVATGSGFCAFKSNYIVTNFHVIEGGRFIKVITDDNRTLNVKDVVVFNKNKDLAIIKIDGSLKPLKIAKTKGIHVKDKVTAIGSPKGELNTVSEGIISNTDDKELIRISLPISHGSSGGVLLNSSHRVIGITNAGYDDAENLNFAIRSEALKKLYSDYKSGQYDSINDSNYKDCAPNIVNYNTTNELRIKNKCSFSNHTNYSTNTLQDFYLVTNSYEIFNTCMYKIGINGLNVNYKSLSYDDQVKASQIYSLLIDYEKCFENGNNECSSSNIDSWTREQIVLKTDVLTSYELAIFITEFDSHKNDMFNYINSLNKDSAEKSILSILYKDQSAHYLTNENAKSVINYISDLNILQEEKDKILTYLGYTIRGDNIYW